MMTQRALPQSKHGGLNRDTYSRTSRTAQHLGCHQLPSSMMRCACQHRRAKPLQHGGLLVVQAEVSKSSIATLEKEVSASELVAVKLALPMKVPFGQVLRLVGGSADFNNWKADNAPNMKWSDGDVWVSNLKLKPGIYEFKALIYDQGNGSVTWEDCPNRVLEVPSMPGSMTVACKWGQNLMGSSFVATMPAFAAKPKDMNGKVSDKPAEKSEAKAEKKEEKTVVKKEEVKAGKTEEKKEGKQDVPKDDPVVVKADVAGGVVSWKSGSGKLNWGAALSKSKASSSDDEEEKGEGITRKAIKGESHAGDDDRKVSSSKKESKDEGREDKVKAHGEGSKTEEKKEKDKDSGAVGGGWKSKLTTAAFQLLKENKDAPLKGNDKEKEKDELKGDVKVLLANKDKETVVGKDKDDLKSDKLSEGKRRAEQMAAALMAAQIKAKEHAAAKVNPTQSTLEKTGGLSAAAVSALAAAHAKAAKFISQGESALSVDTTISMKKEDKDDKSKAKQTDKRHDEPALMKEDKKDDKVKAKQDEQEEKSKKKEEMKTSIAPPPKEVLAAVKMFSSKSSSPEPYTSGGSSSSSRSSSPQLARPAPAEIKSALAAALDSAAAAEARGDKDNIAMLAVRAGSPQPPHMPSISPPSPSLVRQLSSMASKVAVLPKPGVNGAAMAPRREKEDDKDDLVKAKASYNGNGNGNGKTASSSDDKYELVWKDTSSSTTATKPSSKTRHDEGDDNDGDNKSKRSFLKDSGKNGPKSASYIENLVLKAGADSGYSSGRDSLSEQSRDQQNGEEPTIVDALVNVARLTAAAIVTVAGAAVLVQVSQNNLAVNQANKPETTASKPKPAPLPTKVDAVAKAKDKAEEDVKTKKEAEQGKVEADAKAKAEAEKRAALEAEVRAKIEAEIKAKIEAEAKARAKAEQELKELKAKLEAATAVAIPAAATTKNPVGDAASTPNKAAAEVKAAAEPKTVEAQLEALARKAEEERLTKVAADRRKKLEEDEARKAAEAKAKVEVAAARAKAALDAQMKAQLEAEAARARAEAAAQTAKEQADYLSKSSAELELRVQAIQKARAEAEVKAKAAEAAAKAAREAAAAVQASTTAMAKPIVPRRMDVNTTGSAVVAGTSETADKKASSPASAPTPSAPKPTPATDNKPLTTSSSPATPTSDQASVKPKPPTAPSASPAPTKPVDAKPPAATAATAGGGVSSKAASESDDSHPATGAAEKLKSTTPTNTPTPPVKEH